MKHKSPMALVLGTLLILSSLSALAPLRSEASPPALPTRPEDFVPPSGDEGGDEDDQPVGAYIELHVPQKPTGVNGGWTVVQWQDRAGGWHDVEGWRGMLDARGSRRWWVAAKDFGTGPFRWVVSQGPGGPVLGISQSFNLPSEAGQVLLVTASLGTP